ncbi:ferrochelatase [Mucilaginibacter sp. Bleaf8]|uniref:ferrochelatase n=1 Tax=Mucilaginibacter sp. Bleaf8 TaxID=2834430 RepID=UPI001BCECDCF|nr:ferrochelatase [Mucilaginibacter sp. Bleaf8]MBS7566217.1 ferrochelatase [Mucilaginibacter sp. Bleaf8]
MAKKGVLLVNLGTPDSPQTSDVRRYLDEFLMDGRVIDVNPAFRTFLVKGIIVPFRGPKSAKTYQKIWTDEGSPLMVYSVRAAELLKQRLGNEYHVELAMRYQNPSIASALDKLKAAQVDSIKVIALFPQYASATTGSVHDKVMEIVRTWQSIPDMSFVNSFYDNELMIEAFAQNGAKYNPESYDHILFSFHGLPQRQLIKGDDTKRHCLKAADCCQTITDANKFCYSAQSHATARLIAEKLNIPKDKYTITFQSRLGRDPWAQPYTSEIIAELANKGNKRILVFCPAFVADCLETVYEIADEYDTEFRHLGGEKVQLVESLNDSPLWIDTLEQLVTK